MVEAIPVEQSDSHEVNEEWRQKLLDSKEQLNYEQLVHLKCYESGHLVFNKLFEDVPRRLLPGSSKELKLFKNYTSIAPFKQPNEEPIVY